MKKKMLGNLLYILILIILPIFLLSLNDFGAFQEKAVNDTASLPEGLHPIVEEQSKQLIQQAAEKGIEVVITDGFRSAEDQDKLYEKGRSAEGEIVTYAKGGQSYHNFGLAVDFALKTPDGAIIWDRQYDRNTNGVADWTEVVDLAKTLGFEWGGDWEQFKDYPHLEMNFGLTIADLQNGERPPDSSTLTAEQ